jgi:hypothetical protein
LALESSAVLAKTWAACAVARSGAAGRSVPPTRSRLAPLAGPTVFVLLQKGQLNCVSSLGAGALGGGLAELLRLPIAVPVGPVC